MPNLFTINCRHYFYDQEYDNTTIASVIQNSNGFSVISNIRIYRHIRGVSGIDI